MTSTKVASEDRAEPLRAAGALGEVAGLVYPATAAAPVVPSPCETVRIVAGDRMYTRAELDDAVAAERERCARLCEETRCDAYEPGKGLARLIRGLHSTTKGA